MTTPSWSTCRRRSPASTSAFSMRRIPRTGRLRLYNDGMLGTSIAGAGIGTGLECLTATSGCPSLSSGPGSLDGSQLINSYAAGVRYQARSAHWACWPTVSTGQSAPRTTPVPVLGRPADPGHLGTAGQQIQRQLRRLEYRQWRCRADLCRVHGRRQRHWRTKERLFASPMPQNKRYTSHGLYPSKCEVRDRTVDSRYRRRWSTGIRVTCRMTGLTQHPRTGHQSLVSPYTVAPGYTRVWRIHVE